MSGGQVSWLQGAHTRAPPFGLGGARACFSWRIAKAGRHDPDIHSLRHCHAMLRRTLVRGNAILATTEQLAALVTLPPVPWFRGRRQSPGTSRLQHNRRLRATAARTGASAATWQAPLVRCARALHPAIKKGRGAHTFSCGRRCPAGADEGMRCAPWPANCPHPAVPARPRKRGSPRSPREKERRPRRVCNSTVKRARTQPSGSAAPVLRVTGDRAGRRRRLVAGMTGHDILSVAGPAYAERCLLYDFVTAELLARVALCPHRLEPVHRTLKNGRQEFLAFAKQLDEHLSLLGAEFQCPAELLRGVLQMLSRDDCDPLRRQEERVLRQQLRGRSHDVCETVAELRKKTIRASSLVENLNSRLRGDFSLRHQLGADYLSLLQFFFNHRPLERSHRPG